MFTSVWSRNIVAAVAATLVSVTCLTAAVGPAAAPAQTGHALAARVLA